MALLIVAIHTKAFDGAIACYLLKPFLGVAVPTFFILSSMFFFLKLRKGYKKWEQLKHFLFRLCLLYLFWFTVNIVFVEHEHRYFIDGGMCDIVRLIKDVLLRYTFSGSWFFSALGMAVTFYTILYKNNWLIAIFFLISMICLEYIHEIEYLPENIKGFYIWWQSNVREEVTLTILESIPWVGMGYYLSTDRFQTFVKSIKKPYTLSIGFVMLVFICLLNFNYGYKPLQLPIIIMMVLCLILLAGSSKNAPKPIYFVLRKMSVLFFMFHFVAIRIWTLISSHLLHVSSLSEKLGSWGFYGLILLTCFIFSLCFLKFQNYKKLNWLKYGF